MVKGNSHFSISHKKPHIFDKEKLEKAATSPPKQYTLSTIDERLYQMCKTEAWSADLVSQFPNYQNYSKVGIGTVICKDNMIISGAPSYSRYKEGIEKKDIVFNPPGDDVSHFELNPYTKTGRLSKYPLTIHYRTQYYNQYQTPKNCFGSIYYLADGSIGKARLINWVN